MQVITAKREPLTCSVPSTASRAPSRVTRTTGTWGPPKQHYDNFIVIQWGREDVQDNCTSFQDYEHYQRFGMAEENTSIYLCRGAKSDPQKTWWRWKHWN